VLWSATNRGARGGLITRFLRAYCRGARLYHDAVT